MMGCTYEREKGHAKPRRHVPEDSNLEVILTYFWRISLLLDLEEDGG
jgi:hypothetical protein